jgi:hypothetical protein
MAVPQEVVFKAEISSSSDVGERDNSVNRSSSTAVRTSGLPQNRE